jgi:hypothetical protein
MPRPIKSISLCTSNSTSTVQYAGFDPAPDLSQDEKGTKPAKPGVQRGKLYFGWTKSRWFLLGSNIIVSSYFQCEQRGMTRGIIILSILS